MATKQKRNKNLQKQRSALVACAVIVALYIVLTYFIVGRSFLTFAGAHLVLLAITLLFIWIGDAAPKAVLSLAAALSVIGVVTASAAILFYLIILGNLAG